MLKVLEDEYAIKKSRQQFVKSFRPFIDEKIPVNLGHSGGTIKTKVLWSDSLGIWMFHDTISDSRYWHAFGSGKPSASANTPITCEINFPISGIDRRVGGALATDRLGRIFVVHRGKIGGGQKGIGKSLFEDHYRGVWTVMEDGPAETAVALAGVLNSPIFVRQIAQFVRKISRIKSISSFRLPQLEITFEELSFREEIIGTDHTHTLINPESGCEHGLVVKDLHDALVSMGYRAGNDFERDLFIANAKGIVTTVFQIVTDASADSIRSGAVLLLFANINLPGNPLLILVVPEAVDEALSAKLKKLGINTLVFEWQRAQAVFSKLNSLICIKS